MAELVKFHGQVTSVSGSAATIDDDQSVTAAGITDTGGITTSQPITVTGTGNGIYLYNNSGDRVLLTVYDEDGTYDTVKLTRA